MFGASPKKPETEFRAHFLTMRNFYPCCLCLCLLPAFALAADPMLEYKLSGLEGKLLENARAWLGNLPQTPQQRENFVATAQERVENSLKALGYYRPAIETVVERREPVWSLAISVAPGDPVLIGSISIQLHGAATTDEAFQKLLQRIPLAEGGIFNHGDYEQFKNQVLTLGQERGYFDARFTRSKVTINATRDQAEIILHYDSGQRFRFGNIDYSANKLAPRLLAQLQPIQEGDYFDQEKLLLFQSQLQRSGYFASVVIKPRFDLVDDHSVPLSVTLHPARRHSFDVGVGYSTDTQERVSMVWRTPLVNRQGHSQQFRISYSEVNPSGEFIYSIPLSHPLDDMLRLSARVENDKYGSIDSREEELGVLRETRREKWVYSLSGRTLRESWELKDTKFEDTYLLPGFAVSSSERGGSLVDPSSGFSQLYQFEGGSEDLGSDVDLLRTTANFSYVFTPAPRHRVVARSALGAVFVADDDRADLAPSLRFFAGGSQSIRAYGYQSIGNETEVLRDDGSKQTLVVGGDRLVTATLEYQYYFRPSWRGAAFVDAGDAFDSNDFDVKVGPGIGLHYITRVGALRLELANSVSDKDPAWRVVLNIGAEF